MLGSTEPRVYTPPKRGLTPETSLGFSFCVFCEEVLDWHPLPWQEWLAIHALELNEDGTLRFRTVIVEIARQNGKSEFGKALASFFLFVLGVQLVLGTAQSLEIAEEVWDATVDMIEDIPELAREIEKVSRRNGGKALRLVNGERYKIAAATRKGGRGLSSDLVLMDELREHTNWESWSAVTKTTMARPNALVWCMSNAGDMQSVVLRHLRMQAHRALGDPDGICEALEGLEYSEADVDADSLAIFEWSAEPGCNVSDRSQWAKANPSLGYGFLTERALASAMMTDPESEFRTECLCQWVEAVIEAPFPNGAWEAGTDPESELADDAELCFGIDMSDDRSKTAIAVCGLRDDGEYHVEVIAHRVGFEWALNWLRKRSMVEPVRIALQGRGAPISSYIQAISELENVDLVRCEGRDVGSWAGRFYDAVMASGPDSDSDAVPVRHRPQPILDSAARIAQRRGLGDGAWGWDRRKSVDDISALVAATMAFGLATGGRSEEREYASAYASERRMLVI